MRPKNWIHAKPEYYGSNLGGSSCATLTTNGSGAVVLPLAKRSNIFYLEDRFGRPSTLVGTANLSGTPVRDFARIFVDSSAFVGLQRRALTVACTVIFFLPVLAQQNRHPQVESLYLDGIEAIKHGDLPKARVVLEKVTKLSPLSPEGHNSLGWVLFSQGHTGEAISELRIALRLKPDFPQAHVNLANALAQSGHLVEAESEASEAVPW